MPVSSNVRPLSHMPPLSQVRNPIEQKGKRVFIDSLERHKDLSDLFGRIEHLFRNPETREVVLYFRERFRTFPNIIAPLASAISQVRRSGRQVRIVRDFPELLESNVFSPTSFDPIKRTPHAVKCGAIQIHKKPKRFKTRPSNTSQQIWCGKLEPCIRLSGHCTKS